MTHMLIVASIYRFFLAGEIFVMMVVTRKTDILNVKNISPILFQVEKFYHHHQAVQGQSFFWGEVGEGFNTFCKIIRVANNTHNKYLQNLKLY